MTTSAFNTTLCGHQAIIRTNTSGSINTPTNRIGIIQQQPGVISAFHHSIWVSGPKEFTNIIIF